MKSLYFKSLLLSVALLFTSGAMSEAAPKPKNKYGDPAVVTFIHAIPLTFGADKVDVYSDQTLIINDATPGTIKTFQIEDDRQKISVYADGVLPGSQTTPILTFRTVYFAHGMDLTFVAHLNSTEKPTLSLFKNMNTEPGKKRSWLTVRHVAAAPQVDVRTDSVALFRSLASGYERKLSLRYGTYPVKVLLAGTTTNALAPTSIEVKEHKNSIVYVWGSATKGNLQYLTQIVNTK